MIRDWLDGLARYRVGVGLVDIREVIELFSLIESRTFLAGRTSISRGMSSLWNGVTHVNTDNRPVEQGRGQSQVFTSIWLAVTAIAAKDTTLG